jgi:hypothetical protein
LSQGDIHCFSTSQLSEGEVRWGEARRIPFFEWKNREKAFVCQGQIGHKSTQEKVSIGTEKVSIGTWLTIMTYLNGLPVSLLTRLSSLPISGRKEFLETRCSGRRAHPRLLKKAARMLSCDMKGFIQAEPVSAVEKDTRD